MDIQQFKERLTQTILWCTSRVLQSNPKESLRTLRLTTKDSFIKLSNEERTQLVSCVIAERERCLRAEGVQPRPLMALSSGKLLLFYPDGSLFDGAAEAASAGFFDWDNIPAQDTWVHYGADGSGSRENCDENFLVCWIPGEFIRLVDDGISVNPEGCIEWASKVKRPIIRTLIAHGLLS